MSALGQKQISRHSMPTLVSFTNALTNSTSPKRGVPIALIKNCSMGAPAKADFLESTIAARSAA